MIVQAPVGHELIHQNPLAFPKAVPNKFNQVWMMWLIQTKDFTLQKSSQLLVKDSTTKLTTRKNLCILEVLPHSTS